MQCNKETMLQMSVKKTQTRVATYENLVSFLTIKKEHFMFFPNHIWDSSFASEKTYHPLENKVKIILSCNISHTFVIVAELSCPIGRGWLLGSQIGLMALQWATNIWDLVVYF